MSNPTVSQLKSSHYRHLLTLEHQDIVPFVARYYFQERSWLLWAHYLFQFVQFILCILFIPSGTGSLQLLGKVGWAVLAFLALIPLHELLHGLAYRMLGAGDIRFRVSLRYLYAYAIAHHFVVNRRGFVFVALLPFLLISLLIGLGMVLFPAQRFLLACLLLLHTSGTSGDYALLNYYWQERQQAVYTYDDANTMESFFYARRSEYPPDGDDAILS